MPRAVALLVLAVSVAAVSAPPYPAAAGAGLWRWPVDAPHSIIRQYLAPATHYGAGHRGIDIRTPGGTVYAPASGIVHFSGVVVDRPVLSIEHPGGLITSYEPVTSSLGAGDSVSRGEVIGTVLAGHCSTRCLHFGVRLNGEYVSPLIYLGDLPHSVLLPTRRS
jgi:murein DD-endopeptidase MepM/ murein hydrolase activator NlpD